MKIWGYWAIIFTEPVCWALMVIPLIVMTIKQIKKWTKREEEKGSNS